ncbi:Hypothetical predicted protein [Olea europaea subsp. europaea]|uniref:Uncharacterized protein n=1 Tax=Olea europaea subsp. europaea TaxID=158383 RepID=A0A8S0TF88_OLEEU|nr:Hypothetical predicted protein [Olea europaea subsp. europaea]
MKCGVRGQTGHNRRFHRVGAASGDSEELGQRTAAEEEYMAKVIEAYKQANELIGAFEGRANFEYHYENDVVYELLYTSSSTNSQPSPMYFDGNTRPTKLSIRINPTITRSRIQFFVPGHFVLMMQ